MKPNTDTEDQIILAVLEASETEDFERVRHTLPQEDAAGTPLAKVYTEIVGLAPYALDPVTPPAVVKERLMAAVAGAPTEAEEPAAEVTMLAEHPRFRQARQRGSAPPPASWRLLLAAASVALVLFGGASVFFYSQMTEQRQVMASLQQELQKTNVRLEEISGSRHEVMASLRGMALLSSATIEVCPLRPPGDRPLQPTAHGNLVMARQDGKWAVRLSGLEPAASGKVYVLWFLNEEEPVRKEVLGTGEQPFEVGASDMPEKMNAVSVTLEASPDTDQPTTPPVLYGHAREMYRL